MNNIIKDFEVDLHFSSGVYRQNQKDFLDSVRPVFLEYVEKSKNVNTKIDIYPIIQTEMITEDHRVRDFAQYIADVCWQILDSQGFKMDMLLTQVIDMWGQSHFKTSSMEYHTHNGMMLSGFYFLDVPSDSSEVIFHDPRNSKVYSSLVEKNSEQATLASNSIFYTPKPGDIVIANSWLPHSVTRNRSNEQLNFIHFNIGVVQRPEESAVAAVVI